MPVQLYYLLLANRYMINLVLDGEIVYMDSWLSCLYLFPGCFIGTGDSYVSGLSRGTETCGQG